MRGMGDVWQREGDGAIYRSMAADLVRYATVLVGPSEAADVVADAVVSAMTSKQWPGIDNRRGYLFKSTFYKAHDHLRSTSSRRRREDAYAREHADDATSLDPDRWVGDARPEVVRAMTDLSARQRATLYLAYWEDLSPASIAEQLDISEGSVRKHLSRGRAHLRDQLGPLFSVHESETPR